MSQKLQDICHLEVILIQNMIMMLNCYQLKWNSMVKYIIYNNIKYILLVDDDKDNDLEMKFKILDIYNARLDERLKRKKFVIERDMLDLRK